MAEQAKVSRGFHASVPRMVRTGYKTGENKLTVTQKWIYVCLKDLCGDKGACYRSLRTLADETGVSIAMLSKSIPLLDKVGLIHAHQQVKGTWHITIVDIWEQNAQLYPTKCSLSEQSTEVRLPNEQPRPKTVHSINTTVHPMNTNPSDCSPNEQDCSPHELKESVSRIVSSKDTNEGEKEAPPSVNPSLDLWINEKEVRLSKDENVVNGQLQKLAIDIKTKEQFEEVYVLAEKDVNQPGKDGIVKLGNLVSVLPKWRKAQTHLSIVPSVTEEAYNAPSEAEIESLKREIENYNPALIVVIKRGNFGPYVGIKRDDREYRDIPVFSLDDWYDNVMKNDLGLIEQAVKYGKQLKEQVA